MTTDQLMDINQLPDITTLYGSMSPEELASTLEVTVDYVIDEFMPPSRSDGYQP